MKNIKERFYCYAGAATAWAVNIFLTISSLILFIKPEMIKRPEEDISDFAFLIIAFPLIAFCLKLFTGALGDPPSVFIFISIFSVAAITAELRAINNEMYPYIGWAVILFYSVYHYLQTVDRYDLKLYVRKRKSYIELFNENKKVTAALYALLFFSAFQFIFLNGSHLYIKAACLETSTFDHNLFVQSIEGILREGVPVNTLERSRSMNHFAVHFSPVLYLTVPFYYIFRSSEALNLFQLIPVLLGLWPLNRVLKLKDIPLNMRLLFMSMYIAAPTQSFSMHYHFHENCFLGLALLTFWYFWEKQSKIGSILSFIFVLSIKEDTFIYIFAFMLWQIFNAYVQRDNRRIGRASVYLICSLVYFVLISFFMKKMGTGTMEVSRFTNVMPPSSKGYLPLLKVLISRPAFLIGALFSPDKLRYFFLVVAITGFTLFKSKNYSSCFLILPLVFVNLLSDWPYQHLLSYQYHFGTSVFLLMIAVIFAAGEIKDVRKSRQISLLFLLIFSVFISLAFNLPRLKDKREHSKENLTENLEEAREIKKFLSDFPIDKKYYVSGKLTGAMGKFIYLYDTDQKNDEDVAGTVDILIVDKRYTLSEKAEENINAIIEVNPELVLDDKVVPADLPLEIYVKSTGS